MDRLTVAESYFWRLLVAKSQDSLPYLHGPAPLLEEGSHLVSDEAPHHPGVGLAEAHGGAGDKILWKGFLKFLLSFLFFVCLSDIVCGA